MTRDPGLTREDSDYARQIQEVLDELQQMQELPRFVTNPEELDTLEREIRQRTDRLGSRFLGSPLQRTVYSEVLKSDTQSLVMH